VAGRSRTCGASLFRRPLYRTELRPQVDGRGWTRTSSLLFVRQALSTVELLALVEPLELRDKDSNLDLRVQSAVSWPLDDPRSLNLSMSRRARLARCGNDVVYASRLRFDPGSCTPPVARPGHLRPTWRRSGARRSHRSRNMQAKATVIRTASITASKRARSF